MTVSLSILLLLAQIVARALALVGGRQFARVARKDTVEHAHLRAFVRRLHQKGKIGAGDRSLIGIMQQLCHVVAMVARFADMKSPARRAGVEPHPVDPAPHPSRSDAPQRRTHADTS